MGQITPSHLENSFNATIERHFTHTEPDVLAQFLLDKRNPSTRSAYAKDLNDFFRVTTGQVATKDAVLEFLHLERSNALLDWCKAYKHKKKKAPLFVALDFKHKGHRITGDGIYKLVRRYCKQAGITKRMSPHRVRHSSITAALDATDGNVRKVQKLSRHRQIDTLMIYDDNRAKDQVELSEMLSGLTD
jgi:integrase